jgi:hypothetical protein
VINKKVFAYKTTDKFETLSNTQFDFINQEIITEEQQKQKEKEILKNLDELAEKYIYYSSLDKEDIKVKTEKQKVFTKIQREITKYVMMPFVSEEINNKLLVKDKKIPVILEILLKEIKIDPYDNGTYKNKSDLRLHSNYCNGRFSPSSIVLGAKFLGFETIALTDHGSIEGVEELKKAGKKFGQNVLAGMGTIIETNLKIFNKDVPVKQHFIAYNFEETQKLKSILNKYRENRRLIFEESINWINNNFRKMQFQQLKEPHKNILESENCKFDFIKLAKENEIIISDSEKKDFISQLPETALLNDQVLANFMVKKGFFNEDKIINNKNKLIPEKVSPSKLFIEEVQMRLTKERKDLKKYFLSNDNILELLKKENKNVKIFLAHPCYFKYSIYAEIIKEYLKNNKHNLEVFQTVIKKPENLQDNKNEILQKFRKNTMEFKDISLEDYLFNQKIVKDYIKKMKSVLKKDKLLYRKYFLMETIKRNRTLNQKSVFLHNIKLLDNYLNNMKDYYNKIIKLISVYKRDEAIINKTMFRALDDLRKKYLIDGLELKYEEEKDNTEKLLIKYINKNRLLKTFGNFIYKRNNIEKTEIVKKKVRNRFRNVDERKIHFSRKMFQIRKIKRLAWAQKIG